jgi:DHA2 family multidrug resistance protein
VTEDPGWRGWIGFMSMVLGMFMAILDIQIVSSSITYIQAGLAASPDEAAWVQTSYLVAEIVMIPLSGWLSRALSTRLLFTLSALGFTVFSAFCATASSLGEMILWRALQGFIGGAMIPTVFATAFLMFPGRRLIQMQVMVSLTATLAPTIGPTLGGWLTEAFSWHWVFLINLPVGLVVAASVWMFIDIDRPAYGLLRRFDYLGLVLMAAFLGSLEYVLEEGNRWDWFADDTIACFSLLSAVAAVLFLYRMLTRPEPLVDLCAFADRNFALGCLFMGVIGVGLYGAVYIVPLFLAQVRQYDSFEIGKAMFATGIVMFFTGPVAGRISRHVDFRVMTAFGLLCFGVSCWWLAVLTSQSGTWEIMGAQGLRGFSLMFLFLPVTQLSLGTLPPVALKNASGLFNTMRNLGGAIGIAVLGTLATTRTANHWLHLIEQVTWSRPGAMRALAELTQIYAQTRGPDAPAAALRTVGALVEREALTLAYNDVLLVMGLCFFVAIPLTLLLVKPRAAPVPGEA